MTEEDLATAFDTSDQILQALDAGLRGEAGTLEQLEKAASAGILRDAAPFSREVYQGVLRSLQVSWRWRGKKTAEERALNKKRVHVLSIVTSLLQYPEWNWGEEPDANLLFDLQSLAQSSHNCEEDEEILFLILYTAYRDASAFARMRIRRESLGKVCREFVRFSHRNFCVAPFLRVLAFVIEGEVAVERGAAHLRAAFPNLQKLAREVLFPLHATNKWYLWDRQIPLIKLFHTPLVRALETLITASVRLSQVVPNDLAGQPVGDDPMEVDEGNEGAAQLHHSNTTGTTSSCAIISPSTFLEDALQQACVKKWPPPTEANTAKEVLLLQEMRSLLRVWGTAVVAPSGAAPNAPSVSQTFEERLSPILLPKLCACLKSLNAQVIESALLFWKDESFTAMLFATSRKSVAKWLAMLLPLLWREELFWNPTVNKMTALVLEKFRAQHRQLFEETVRQIWESRQLLSHARRENPRRGDPGFSTDLAAGGAIGAPAKTLGLGSLSRGGPGAATGSVAQQMREWREQGSGGAAPPSTITGVAPWARGPAGGGTGTSRQPPATITGVAPWAMGGAAGHAGSTSMRGGRGPVIPGGVGSRLGLLGPLEETSGASAESEQLISQMKPSADSDQDPALKAMGEYLKKLNPRSDIVRDWDDQLLSLTPTWLPSLKFHDVVYGNQDLGRGAFSVVKYGRTVLKSKTQSEWPEYAVKVVSIETIKKHNYVRQVNQEIAVLKHLSHPNICRLVSAFRWRDGAYLVLEFCSQGDLHSYVTNQGTLDDLSTFRFVAGEILAGLTVVHEQGFAFADMKPENVVITSSGHCKLTDFGGARPLTDAAKQKLNVELLANLRSGEDDYILDQRSMLSNAEGGAAGAIEQDQTLLAGSARTEERGTTPSQPEDVEDELKFEGTGAYMAPELRQRRTAPSVKSDAWALGVTYWFLRRGRLPEWASVLDEDLPPGAASSAVSFDLREQERSAQQETSPEVRNLLQSLLAEDPDDRPAIVQLAYDQKDWLNQDLEYGHCLTFYTRKQGPLKNGTAFSAAAAPDSSDPWAKRQFSKIWTVMSSELEQGESTATGKKTALPGSHSYLYIPFSPKSPEESTGEF
ncbi:unnamed protein product [Amoebophrya sp. A120]|nr:unnamed protein product [Amoebophrya sp. A120]|eukprot:GSA120T00001974001.1